MQRYMTIVFILSALADQRKLHQNDGLENMNMTSNYDVTHNAHQIQMIPYATECKPPWKFSAYATDSTTSKLVETGKNCYDFHLN